MCGTAKSAMQNHAMFSSLLPHATLFKYSFFAKIYFHGGFS